MIVGPRERDRRTPGRRTRVGLGLVLLVLLAVAVWRSLPQGEGLPLDPDAAGDKGAKAVAEVLRRQGVEVDVVRTRADLDDARVDADTTLVVSETGAVTAEAMRAVSERRVDAGRLVLLGLGRSALHDLDLPVTLTRPRGDEPGGPGCTDRVAAASPSLSPLGSGYALMTPAQVAAAAKEPSRLPPFPGSGPGEDGDGPEDVTDLGRSWTLTGAGGCYPVGEGHALLTIPAAHGQPRTDLLAPALIITNGTVTEEDDAALALRLLGSERHLVWFAPTYADIAEGDIPRGEPPIAPPWFMPLLLLLGGAVALTMWWRGRRLGRLAVEPLPVVVRASETAVARGRLYRRAAGRGHAAAALRDATRRRLAARLGLPVGADAEAVVAAVAQATGRERDGIRDLLAGPDPTTDADLAATAADLAQLEEEVRHP
ncbi:hypothetical protein ADJ73_16150 [Arsenicicoccus sp. oral taxon 190]|nr:hypothetical protein ADJ73_16150 [Arsenicicoccus sp. oral taxon 190]